jgi:hypothetical protein
MVIKFTNIFHSKALQIDPNWDFWYENKLSGNPAWTNGKVRLDPGDSPKIVGKTSN